MTFLFKAITAFLIPSFNTILLPVLVLVGVFDREEGAGHSARLCPWLIVLINLFNRGLLRESLFWYQVIVMFQEGQTCRFRQRFDWFDRFKFWLAVLWIGRHPEHLLGYYVALAFLFVLSNYLFNRDYSRWPLFPLVSWYFPHELPQENVFWIIFLFCLSTASSFHFLADARVKAHMVRDRFWLTEHLLWKSILTLIALPTSITGQIWVFLFENWKTTTLSIHFLEL